MTASDPILAALARWHAADAAYQAAHARARAKWPHDPIRAEEVANRATWAARDVALEEFYATRPTTLAGLAALATVLCEEDLDVVLESGQTGRGLHTLLRTIQYLGLEEACGRLLDGVTPQSSARPRLAVA